jgi:hypothetical protein
VLLRAVKREDIERQWIAENDPELFYLNGGKSCPCNWKTGTSILIMKPIDTL